MIQASVVQHLDAMGKRCLRDSVTASTEYALQQGDPDLSNAHMNALHCQSDREAQAHCC